MSATERLYYHDSRLLEFDARVTDLSERDDGAIAVMLDRTAFYPTGGGQPNDTGSLGEARVVDVFEDEANIIYHVVQAGSFEPGRTVSGVVDRGRRLDHLQQHSGQHLLSQAFVQTCGAETRSFHLGSQTSTIDIEL